MSCHADHKKRGETVSRPLAFLLLLLLLTNALPVLAQSDQETAELRALLKAPVVKQTGAYVTAENVQRLRALLKAEPILVNQPIYALRGEQVSTPLVEAVKIGNVDAVRVLLELKAKPDLALGKPPIPPLQLAITSRLGAEVRLAIIDLLLARGAYPGDALHAWAGCTNWTDRKTYFAAADALVRAKADVNSRNESGATPLQIAVVHDNVLAAEKLFASGANVDDLIKDLAYAGRGTAEGDQILKILKIPPPR
jgi:hypothetical protein